MYQFVFATIRWKK